MSIWFFLWFIMAAILLGSTAWSTIILLQQKQAWKAYAAKKDLRFNFGKFFSPCEMDGSIDGFDISFFTAVQQNPEARKNRQLTVFQITDPNKYVDGAACGTAEVKNFIDALDALSPHDVSSPSWDKKHLIHTRNKKSVDAFLTEDRIKILKGMLDFPGADVLLILDEKEGVFRFETASPLTNLEKIETTIDKLIMRIKKLRSTDEEAQQYESLKDPVEPIKPETQSVLESSTLVDPES